MLALPLIVLMMMMPGEPQDLQAVTYLGDEILQEMGFAKEPKTSGAQKISGKLKRASTAAQKNNIKGENQLYDGPVFSGYDCFSDKAPTLLKMPVGCRTSTGDKAYTGKEQMKKASVNLYQASTTREFTGRFCKVERSTSA